MSGIGLFMLVGILLFAFGHPICGGILIVIAILAGIQS